MTGPMTFILIVSSAAVGLIMMTCWLLFPKPRHVVPARRTTANEVLQRVWPGWDTHPEWRAATILLSLALGGWLSWNLLTPKAALVLAPMLALLVPRMLRNLLALQSNEYPTARAILEEARDVMARGQSTREAFRRMEARRDAVAAIARDINVAVERHDPVEVVLRQIAASKGPVLRRTLNRLALFIAQGYWAPNAVPTLDRQIRSIESRRRLDDEARLETTTLRRFRMGAIVLIPTLVLMVGRMNSNLYGPFFHTAFGVFCMLAAIVLFVMIIVIPAWLTPAPEMS